MQRKWIILGVTMTAVTVLATGISAAQDDEGPLHKLMEQVNAKTVAIKKAVRTPVAYKKAQASKDLVVNGEALVKLSKEGRGMGAEASKKAKGITEPEKKWVELMDAFTGQCEKFVAIAGKADTTQAQAKSAFGVVSQSCTDCHNVFRVEEDEKF